MSFGIAIEKNEHKTMHWQNRREGIKTLALEILQGWFVTGLFSFKLDR